MENSNNASNKTNEGFFKYLLNFDDGQKSMIMNSIQYIILAYGPLNTLDHITTNWFPDYKNEISDVESWRLLGEMFLEIVFIFLYIFIVDKIIRYIPTYSGEPMGNLNFIQLVITLLIFRFNHADSLLKKQRELQKRVENTVNGGPATANKSRKASTVKVSQPISRNGTPQTMPTHATSRADYINQHQNQVAPQEQMSATSGQIYGGPTNKLINTEWPNNQSGGAGGGQEGFQEMGAPVQTEPAAANGVLGGSFGSAW